VKRRLAVIGGLVLVAVLIGSLALRAAVHEGYLGELRDRLSDNRPAASVTDLGGVSDLQAAFNQAQGSPRLLLLLSPT
jgi:hypothetical protein